MTHRKRCRRIKTTFSDIELRKRERKRERQRDHRIIWRVNSSYYKANNEICKAHAKAKNWKTEAKKRTMKGANKIVNNWKQGCSNKVIQILLHLFSIFKILL